MQSCTDLLRWAYLFNYCFDILMLLRGYAGFGTEGGEVDEYFVVGEDGGLGFEDLVSGC